MSLVRKPLEFECHVGHRHVGLRRMHGQLLRLGESMFGDPTAQVQYFMLRAEPTKPECDMNVDVDAEVARQVSAPAAASDDIDNLFGDEPTAVDPVALRSSVM